MKRSIAVLVVILLAWGPLMAATWVGRLMGKVVDPEGNPLEGVAITVSSPDIEGFGDSDTTDKRGRFRVDFPRQSVAYKLVFEKEGLQTYHHWLDWKIAGTASETFTMNPVDALMEQAPQASQENSAIQAFNAGVAAYGARDLEKAGNLFAEALKYNPDLHQAWTAIAMVRQDQGQHQEAADAAENAIRLGSEDPVVFRTRWSAYRDLGDDAKAAEALAAFNDPVLRNDEAKKLHNQAIALKKAGDLEGAFADFRQSTVLDPTLKPAWFGMATSGLQLGHYAAAADAAEAILALDPGNEQAIRLRYNACLELEDYARLFDAMVGLYAVEPDIGEQGMVSIAYADYDAGNKELAVERFSKVLELIPDQPRAHYYLGLMKLETGASQEAKSHLERVLQLMPDTRESAVAAELLKTMN